MRYGKRKRTMAKTPMSSRTRKMAKPMGGVARRLTFKKRTMRARTTSKGRKRPIGVYKARKGVASKYSAASRYGVERVVDVGGLMQNEFSLYIGHSTTCIPEQMKSVAYAIVRKLFARAGIDFSDWKRQNDRWVVVNNENPPGQAFLALYYTYTDQNNSGFGEPTSNIIQLNTTPEDSAIGLYNQMVNDLSPVGREPTTFYLVKYNGDFQGVVNPNNILERYATLQANSILVHLQTKSELVIQNRTQAAGVTGTGGEAIETLVNDIGANPLIGMYYTTTGNVFRDASMRRDAILPPVIPPGELQPNDSINVSSKGLAADNANGLIRRDAGTSSWAAYPPNPKLIGAKTGNKISVLPGSMRKSNLFHKFVCKLTTLLITFQRQAGLLGADNEFPAVEWGKSALFGLRLQLNAGSEERQPKLAYQLKWEHKVHLTAKRSEPLQAIVETRRVPGPPAPP